MDSIPIIKRKDYFGAEYLAINTTKRKAWNLLLKNGGEVQPNKRYIKHNNLLWHNNSLLKELIHVEEPKTTSF